MITSKNIKAYINFLHQKRTGDAAPETLLEKWSSLNDADIQTQLLNLYKHWDLNPEQAQVHEKNFIAFSEPKLVTPPSVTVAPPPYQPILENKKQKSNAGLIIFIAIIIVGIIGVLLYLNQTDSDNTTITEKPQLLPKPTTEIETPVSTPPSADSSIDSTTTTTVDIEITDTDRSNMRSISSLLDDEINQDFEKVASHFSQDLRKYWDLETPTYERLEQRYKNVWSKIENPQNKDIQIIKIGTNRYRLTGKFEYYSINHQEQKSVPVNTIYEFDDNGKIVYENSGE